MKTTDFTEIAARYERDSLIQKSAAEELIGLLGIQRNDDVLDLGCGTGSLARKIKSMTEGAVIGVDPSEGMIREAVAKREGLNITFAVSTAENLAFHDDFSVIFCNSAFQWFRDPARALANCYSALRKGGRMGIQAPAKMRYCPNFLAAIDAVAHHPKTAETFAGFRVPWIFFDWPEKYSALFKQAGFSVPFSVIEEIKALHSPNEVMTIFESGAAAGYLNQTFYETQLSEAYCETFRAIIKDSFYRQANRNGQVELTFNRIYLLAVK